MLGPVQILVVGVDSLDTAATVLASVAALPADAPVRCLDSFVVEVADDGGVEIDADGSPSIALFAGEAADDQSPAGEQTWSLADVVAPGTTAVVVVLEHRWAIGLVDSMVAVGAALVHESWLDEQDRADLEALLAP